MEISVNDVRIKGLVDEDPVFNHEWHGEKFYKIVVLTERLSGVVDEVPVIMSERLIDMSKIESDMVIDITGHIRTFNEWLIEGEKKSKLHVYVFAKLINEVGIYENPFTDINAVDLTGFICKSPIYRKTPKEREICDLIVAVNRSYGKSYYIPCIVWGEDARHASELEIGNEVVLHGRFQSRDYIKRYDDDSIAKKTAYEISVKNIKKLEEEKGNEEE